MNLTTEQFQQAYENCQLHLAFIGMSNIGKSFLSSRLKDTFGFGVIEVDTEIQHRLDQSDMAQSANWMGFPYSDGYAEKEAAYLELEAEETSRALRSLSGNTIIDTTGSVIHLAKEIQDALKARTLVVNIDAGDEDLRVLNNLYFQHPKPTVWGPHFDRSAAERAEDALLASLPRLLSARRNLYRRLEDVRLRAGELRELGFEANDVWKLILSRLA